MPYERITDDPKFDGKCRYSHELRYRIAGAFVFNGDTILDACCGTGYGEKFLVGKKSVKYIGIDKNPVFEKHTKYDFENDDIDDSSVNFRPDVFVGLEAIEHLDSMGVVNFVSIAKRARNWIIISTPVIPNSNPYHKQQFTEDKIISLFADDQFELYAKLRQDDTYGIFIFKRKTND